MPDQLLPPGFSAYIPDILEAHAEMMARAVLCLPLAAALGAGLAFRPRRKGTPARSASVIQTQIVLAVIGALVMLIVGSSIARAFGIVGAANLIRYRAMIDDPKDAVVMLATLSLGLAAGVELYGLALFGTLFILAALWAVESLEPERHKTFELTVAATDPGTLRAGVEGILRRFEIKYELRSAGAKELTYETHLPLDVRTGRVANAILKLESEGEKEVVWEEKKKKKK